MEVLVRGQIRGRLAEEGEVVGAGFGGDGKAGGLVLGERIAALGGGHRIDRFRAAGTGREAGDQGCAERQRGEDAEGRGDGDAFVGPVQEILQGVHPHAPAAPLRCFRRGGY